MGKSIRRLISMKKEDQTTSEVRSNHSSGQEEGSYVWIGRGWLIGIVVLVVVLISGSLWFAFGTDSATVFEEVTIYAPKDQSSSDSASDNSSSSSSTTDAEDRGLELAKEIKELASQGRVYGVPFHVNTSLSEVNRVWGTYDDYFSGTPYWSFDDKDVGVYTESIDFNNGQACAIFLGYFKGEGSLPLRYQEMTFDDVKKVFGTNYRLEQRVSNAGTHPTEVYFYHLPPYGVEFLVSEEKIRMLRVGTERCGIFGSKVDFFYR
jgi:hypothetical protein